jgi:hypothetical protein
MAVNSRSRPRPKTRRTTLTLPEASLVRAERIARTRHVNLSTVVAESLAEGLAVFERTTRSDEILEAYKRSFSSLTEEEQELVDGIVLEPVASQGVRSR